jgi:hypothetical protein
MRFQAKKPSRSGRCENCRDSPRRRGSYGSAGKRPRKGTEMSSMQMCAKREKCECLEGVVILIREAEESGAMRCSDKQHHQCMTHGAVMCCLCISPARGFPISANNTTAVLSLPPPVRTPSRRSLYSLAALEWFLSTTRARQPIIPMPSFRRTDFWAAREEHILPPHRSCFTLPCSRTLAASSAHPPTSACPSPS